MRSVDKLLGPIFNSFCSISLDCRLCTKIMYALIHLCTISSCLSLPFIASCLVCHVGQECRFFFQELPMIPTLQHTHTYTHLTHHTRITHMHTSHASLTSHITQHYTYLLHQCLDILNYFRSVERTLTINSEGLSLEARQQQQPSHSRGLLDHRHLFKTPADYV